MFCFSYIVDIYESEKSMFYQYLVLFTMGALEVQSISHVFGILTYESIRVGVFTIIGFGIFLTMFSNVLIPIKELHYSLQLFSNLASIKLLIESLMVLFYGLDRCSDREFSYILSILDIEDMDLYINVSLLIAQFFIFRAIALLILIMKLNPMVNNKKVVNYRRKSVHQITTLDFKTTVGSNLFI